MWLALGCRFIINNARVSIRIGWGRNHTEPIILLGIVCRGRERAGACPTVHRRVLANTVVGERSTDQSLYTLMPARTASSAKMLKLLNFKSCSCSNATVFREKPHFGSSGVPVY